MSSYTLQLLDLHRKVLGLTYAELGRRAGMGKNRVWGIFQCKTGPSIYTLEKLAAAMDLRITVDDMAQFPGNKPISSTSKNRLTEPRSVVCSIPPGNSAHNPKDQK